MSDILVNPYIFFKGNCREAMDFYKSIFGGELTFQTNADAGAAAEDRPADHIMHAMLEGEVMLMASDTDQASDEAAKVSISINGSDEEKLRKFFDGLSEDVKVEFPLEKQFWGDIFGAVKDKYGVEWMINISQASNK